MNDPGRRKVLIGVGALSMISPLFAASAAASWQTASPEDVGFAEGLGEKLDAGIRSGLLRGLHAVLVVRAGKLVLERYYEGPDENWGRPLGQVTFGPDTLHDLRSVTKSIVGLVYGIALDRGLVPPPEAPLLEQFPEYADLAADPERAALKVGHVLTMTLGTEWNEQIPYTDPRNSEIMMENAEDRYRFILDQPIVAPPGTRWIYNGGCTALLGRLIEKGSGKTLPEFASEALFAPLGISEFEWARGGDGAYSAASGLRLRPRDLARIGELVIGEGKLGDRRVVPAGWLADSFRPVIATGFGVDYGQHWYAGEIEVPALDGPQRWVGGFGNGGQRLWLMPSAALCAVIVAGNYNRPDDWVFPTRIWREIVLPNLHET